METSNVKSVDYLIVGQGLAGSCLALELLREGFTVMVYDLPDQNRSSWIAAGLFNPITGKILTKTWRAELLFPALHSFYTSAEESLQEHFFHPMPLYRPFLSVEEQNEWMGKSTDPFIRPFIREIRLTPTFEQHVKDPFGGLLIEQGGYLDTRIFLQAVRQRLIAVGAYREEDWLADACVHLPEGIRYADLNARKVIFCGGVRDGTAAWLRGLPIRPLKGEILEIEMDDVERIYNRGVFVAPSAEPRRYRVGATYDRDLTPDITSAGQQDLKEKLAELIRQPFAVISGDWGIRPTTPDRRIMLGGHPFLENVIVFNGLGTKGVSLAPYYAKQLISWLKGLGEIDKEVNIQRFKSLYSKFD